MSVEHLCKNCGNSFQRYTSTQTICPRCSYNKYGPGLRAKKPVNRVGKVTKQWIDTRAQWIKDNPPNHQGYWECALRVSPYCIRFMDIDQLTLDHIQGRGRRPGLRNDPANIQPACVFCNGEKGSNARS